MGWKRKPFLWDSHDLYTTDFCQYGEVCLPECRVLGGWSVTVWILILCILELES